MRWTIRSVDHKSAAGVGGRIGRAASALCRDTRGATAIALGLALPVLMGLGFLAVDSGRHYNLHTSLQSAADAFALAGAAELDRRDDSIRRANRAIEQLLDNHQRFGEGEALLTAQDISWRFLDGLPDSDADPITGYETNTPREARHIEVSVHPVGLDGSVLAAMLGMAGPIETRASSVGGFDQGMCEYSPFFICNPFEETGQSIFEEAKSSSWKRRLIALRLKGGNGAQLGSGNYGFLASPHGRGANELREMIARETPPGCFVQNGVDTEPGFKESVGKAINDRFDQAESTREFPRDLCLEDDSCDPVGNNASGRFGDGYWTFEDYWAANFSGVSPTVLSASGEQAYSDDNPPSRYQVYRYDIERNDHGADAPVDRRIMNAAIIDCVAEDVGGRTEDLRVSGIARMFLTESIGNDDTVWAEMVDVIEPGTPAAAEILRDIVQLQR